MPKAVAQFTIRDDNDITVGVSAPPSPVIDQLWLDTSSTPSQMKRYNGSSWDVVNDVQVGGRNLGKYGCITPYNAYGYTTVDITDFISSGKAIINRQALLNEGPIIDRYTVYETGKDYIISFKLKTLSGDVNSIYVYNGCGHTDGKVYIDNSYMGGFASDITFPTDNNYHKITLTFKAGSVDRGDASTQNTTHTLLQPMKRTTTAYSMEIDNFKIEKGNIATDWTPAPEDIGGKLSKTVKAVDVMYYLSSSSTSLVGGSWQTTAPAWVNGKYMWSKTTTVFADGTSSDSDPTCIAGATGSSGVGVKTTVITYQASASGTTTPTGTWSSTIPTVSAGQYLWTRTVITYTDNSTATSYSIGKMGENGANGVNGSDGKGVKSTTITYQASASGTSVPSGSWISTIPTVSAGQYLWTRTVITYTDNKTSTSYSIGKMGEQGSPGANGQGVSSIIEEYYLSSSKTTQTGGSWVTQPPSWSSGMYMWTRSKITYINPSKIEYTKPICDSSWEAVNDVVIGGRNLIMKTSSDFVTTPSISSFVYIMTATDIGALGLVPGDMVTFRIYLKPQAGTTDKIMARVSQYYGNGTTYQNDLGNAFIGGQEGYSTVTTTIRSDIHSKGIFLSINNMSRVDNPTVQYKEAKFERGNKATDWSPAPEDTYQSIHDLDERVYTAEQKVEKDAIISTVTESSVWKTIQTKLINNFSISGTMDQWSTNSACAMVVDSEVGNYMSITTTSNVMVTSDYFEIDPSASYKLSLMIKNPSASGTGSWYFGIYAYDKDKSSIGVYVGSGTSLQTNPYFAWESKANQNLKWRTFDGYLYSHNTTIDTYTPKGNSTYCFRMDPKTKYVRVRFLHYRAPSSYGDGSSGSMYYAHPTITSIDNIIVDTETRLKTAEVSILPGSIISTVTNSTNWSSLNNTANTALANANSALQKITPSEILNAVNTQIGNGGQINTVSTILDKTGFTVKNGAIKVQNKAGTTVLSGDTNGNLVMSGSINVNTQNAQQLYVNTNDSKLPVLVAQAKGTFSRSLAITNEFLAWSNDNAWSGVNITPSGISTPSLNSSDIRVSGTVTAGIVHATSNGQGTNFKIGDDCWLGDVNEYATVKLQCQDGSGKGYLRFGNGGKIGYNGGTHFELQGDTWIAGEVHADYGYSVSGIGDRCDNAPWYGLGRTWLDLGGGSATAVQVAGYYGLRLRANTSLIDLNYNTYNTYLRGHWMPYDTRNYWLGTNSPDKQWKGLCAEGGVVGASDIRFKENIERLNGDVVTFNEVTDEIAEYSISNFRTVTRANQNDYYEFIRDRFKPAYYNYKMNSSTVNSDGEFDIDPLDEYNMLKNVGFIAQDYNLDEDPVAREFIFTNENGEYSYNHMSYVTVGMIALQEAIKKIDDLEDQVEQLQNKNKELEDRLKVLEDLIISK